MGARERLVPLVVALLVVSAGCAGVGSVGGLGNVLGGGPGTSGGAHVVWTAHPVPQNGTLTYRSAGARRIGGTTYVVAPLGSNVRNCTLVAMNGTGGTLWRHDVTDQGGRCRAQDVATPLVTSLAGRPTVIVAMKDRLHAFDARTGAPRFAVRLPSDAFTAPVVLGGSTPLVVYPAMKGTVYAVHPNGTVAWRRHLHSIATGEQPQVVHPAHGPPLVVVGGANSVAAFRPNGSVAWRRNVSARFLRAGRVGGRPVLVAAAEHHVSALYANGTTAWTHRTNASMTVGAVGPPRRGAAPLAYVTDDGGTALAYYASNGTLAWRHPLEGHRRYVPPAALASLGGGDARQVVVGTVNGRVRVLNATTGVAVGGYHRKGSLWTRPTVYRTADGRERVALTYEDGTVVALSYGP